MYGTNEPSFYCLYNMELTIIERIILQNALPKEWAYLELLVVKSISSKVVITWEEVKEFCIESTDNGGIVIKKQWREEYLVKYELEPSEVSIISGVLKKLDEQKKLDMSTISLYEKFCQ